MNSQTDIKKKFFLITFLLICFLPLFQFVFSPFKLRSLQGAYELTIMPKPTYHSIVNMNFQDCTALFLKHQSPFRGDLVRLRNQIDYSFYKRINTILTLGKDNYIFDPFYIKAHKGEDYLSEETREKKINSITKTKFLLDSLNVPLLFCIAPNKANLYKEKLNTEYKSSTNTNQNYFEQKLTELNFNIINFDSIFNQLKTSEKYPLIPKYGAHWSTYGAFLASQILLEKIETIKNEKYAEVILDSISTSTKAKYSDDDYIPSLNLIEHFPSPTLAYPHLTINSKNKLNVLIISDSFFWNFYDLEIPQNCFTENSEMWYYNKSKFDIYHNEIGKTADNIDIKTIKNRDLIILLSVAPSMVDFGFGFFEQVANLKNEN